VEEHFENFFVEPDKISVDRVRFDGSEFHHLVKVKRKAVGDQVNVVDGTGNFYSTRLIEIKSGHAIGEIAKKQRRVGELAVSIQLVQGVIRHQRMDWIIEKGTELGVDRFIPLQTEYCQFRPSELKFQRWKRLARNAVKQCGRSVLPKVDDLPDCLRSSSVIFAHPLKHVGVKNVIEKMQQKHQQPLQSISLIVGPEGGFSDTEVEQFLRWGYNQVDLGQRRLRAETAAITLLVLTLEAIGEV
jgi:16S rRNA (uracil1498-N3)-methyltransferase